MFENIDWEVIFKVGGLIISLIGGIFGTHSIIKNANKNNVSLNIDIGNL
jgi:hypothetical protein